MAKDRRNIFKGDGYFPNFVNAAYKLICSKKEFTNTDIMKECVNAKLRQQLEAGQVSVTSCEGYGELKKAILELKKMIGEDLVESGHNRHKTFQYVGKDPDPLSNLRNAKVAGDAAKFFQFCQDSTGFFPKSWLEYFFKDSVFLSEVKAKHNKGEQVLNASLDRMLKNIEYLPFLYEAIKQKKVLKLSYQPYGGEEKSLVLHPHYLKEYNGRWHLFGIENDEGKIKTPDIALDRLVSIPEKKDDVQYIPAKIGHYSEYFSTRVGVSRMKRNNGVKDIRVRAYTSYLYGLVDTKKFHPTQEVTIEFGKHEDGEYGEFSLKVEINNELLGAILQMGDGLEIVAPEEARSLMAERVAKLASRYMVCEKKD